MKQEMLRMGILTALITTALTGAAWAMPSGGTLAQGNVTVDQGSLSAVTSGATIKATEDSVIDWTEFDLAAVDELHFDTLCRRAKRPCCAAKSRRSAHIL